MWMDKLWVDLVTTPWELARTGRAFRLLFAYKIEDAQVEPFYPGPRESWRAGGPTNLSLITHYSGQILYPPIPTRRRITSATCVRRGKRCFRLENSARFGRVPKTSRDFDQLLAHGCCTALGPTGRTTEPRPMRRTPKGATSSSRWRNRRRARMKARRTEKGRGKVVRLDRV